MRTQSQETKDRIRESVANKWKDPEYRAQLLELSIQRESQRPWESLSHGARRSRILLEQEGKCAHCGIQDWNGKDLTLEMDHINGDKTDNSRTNLECICPNCHSQTDTWRGRNAKGRQPSCWVHKDGREELIPVPELQAWQDSGFTKGRVKKWSSTPA